MMPSMRYRFERGHELPVQSFRPAVRVFACAHCYIQVL